jgi:hypothetical protein
MQRHLTGREQALRVINYFVDNIDSLFPKDKASSYVLEITDANDKHSELQRAYRWGWVYPELAKALDDAGHMLGDQPYTKAAVHAETQHALRIKNHWNENGVDYYEYESTSNLSKKAYTADIEMINRYYISKYGIGIPDHRDNEYYSKIAGAVLDAS